MDVTIRVKMNTPEIDGYQSFIHEVEVVIPLIGPQLWESQNHWQQVERAIQCIANTILAPPRLVTWDDHSLDPKELKIPAPPGVPF